MPQPQPRRSSLMDWIWPLIVLLVALGARSWYLAELADFGKSDAPLHVQDNRPQDLTQELSLLQDEKDFYSEAPFSNGPERTAHAAPGYLFFVFGLRQLPLNGDQAVRWTQCALGALSAMLYYF